MCSCAKGRGIAERERERERERRGGGTFEEARRRRRFCWCGGWRGGAVPIRCCWRPPRACNSVGGLPLRRVAPSLSFEVAPPRYMLRIALPPPPLSLSLSLSLSPKYLYIVNSVIRKLFQNAVLCKLLLVECKLTHTVKRKLYTVKSKFSSVFGRLFKSLRSLPNTKVYFLQ